GDSGIVLPEQCLLLLGPLPLPRHTEKDSKRADLTIFQGQYTMLGHSKTSLNGKLRPAHGHGDGHSTCK
ncbi:MAG TPA: hypothetical protein VGB32_06630, partial [Candidatus Bathyarchaeia archaeon]